MTLSQGHHSKLLVPKAHSAHHVGWWHQQDVGFEIYCMWMMASRTAILLTGCSQSAAAQWRFRAQREVTWCTQGVACILFDVPDQLSFTGRIGWLSGWITIQYGQPDHAEHHADNVYASLVVYSQQALQSCWIDAVA